MLRHDFLVRLLLRRRHTVGAEVGVRTGATSAHLLSSLPDLACLYCVDPWTYYPDYESDRKGQWPNQPLLDAAHTEATRRLSPFGERSVVIRLRSDEASRLVADEALDFVFIDANHAYAYVRQDIALWTPKVRTGGIVAGHDYSVRPGVWGVKRAVDEAFGGLAQIGCDHVWWTERH